MGSIRVLAAINIKSEYLEWIFKIFKLEFYFSEKKEAQLNESYFLELERPANFWISILIFC